MSRQNSNATIKASSYTQIYQERRQQSIQTDMTIEEMAKLIDRLVKAERQLTAENQANEELSEQLLFADNQAFKQRQELVARNKIIE
jgi:hypothetical protein